MAKRQEKKSESIEIRLPYSQKTAFIEACREQGISASEALRSQIDAFVRKQEKPHRPIQFGAALNMLERHRKKTLTAVATTATALSLAFALPSAASSELFKSIDKNGDGVLTAGEISPNDSKVFALLDKDGSGKITPDEFQKNAEIINVTDSMVPAKEKGQPDVRVIEVERTSFSISGPDDVAVWVQKWAEEVDPKANDTDVKNVVERMKLQLNEVQEIDQLDKLDAAERAGVMAEIKKAENLHTIIELRELRNIREDLKGLENIDLDLKDLKDLESFDFRFEFDFADLPDFEELEKMLTDLEASPNNNFTDAHREEFAKAREELGRAREELEKLKGMKRIFVIRNETGDIDHTDEHGRSVVVKKKVIRTDVTPDTSDKGE